MWIVQMPCALSIGRARPTAAITACAVFIGLIALPACADDTLLTFGQAQRIAVERSQQLAAADLGIDASRERARIAGSLPDPMLKFGVDNLPIEGATRFSTQRDFMTMRRVGLSQDWVRPSTRRLRDERGVDAVKISEAERAVALATVERETANAWLEVHFATARIAESTAQKSEAEREAAAVESAFREGKGTLADVFAARGGSAEVEDLVIDATRRLQMTRSALSRWVGDAAIRPLAGAPAIDALPWHTHELAAQLADHPDIRLASERTALARTDLMLAEASRKPDWSVDLSYAARGEGFSNMASIGFSVPIQVNRRDRQNREVAARRAELAQSEADREDMRRAHTADVDALLADWEANRTRRDHYRTDSLPLAAHRCEAALAAYRGGRGLLADVLAARRNEIETRLKLIDIEATAARAWVALAYLVPDPTLSAPERSPSSENLP